MDTALSILSTLARIILSAISEAASWAYWSRKARENACVTEPTYGRRHRRIANILADLGAIQFWAAAIAVTVLIVVGIYLIP